VPNELLDQIGEALDLDSHSHPGREVVALLGRALETYVSRRKKERFHVTDRPRPLSSHGSERARAPPRSPDQTKPFVQNEQEPCTEAAGQRCGHAQLAASTTPTCRHLAPRDSRVHSMSASDPRRRPRGSH